MPRVTVTERDLGVIAGIHDRNLRTLESLTGARVFARGEQIHLEGDESAVARAEGILTRVAALRQGGYVLQKGDWDAACRVLVDDPAADLEEIFVRKRIHPSERKSVASKSGNQRRYVEAIRTTDIVFGIGPAGTGKTYLAVALALEAFHEKRVSRIVLTRPAVEAGEKLGFLPGGISEKVDPYLRPLYDAIFDLLDRPRALRLVENGEIEVAPLAFMRGRTLNDSFAILDEAQNTTSEQMKMFLTRMGLNSRTVITGDVTQIDLPQGKTSGLVEARRILAHVDGIKMIEFDQKDVIRHTLVQKIIQAYEQGGGRGPESPTTTSGEKG